jgi:hypothetical protein
VSFTYHLLNDELKRELCIQLLTEFGVDNFTETTKGELRHRCTLPLAGHTDRNSVTASINYKKLTFHCFVCQNAGGILWWIAVNRRESTEEAKKWLQASSGVSEVLDLRMLQKLLENLFHARREEVTPLPAYGDQVISPWSHDHWGMFHPYMTDPWAPGGTGGRECPEENLARFEVGYCDVDHDWHYYQRIIIPLRWDGKIVGWQARRLDPEDPEQAKYKNSPDFPRDRTIYGYDQVRERWGNDLAIVVESPASVLRHFHHLPIISTMGASISDLQVQLLHRFRRVTWWLDNDKAGWDALAGTKQNAGVLDRLKAYSEQRVVVSPYAVADPADFTEHDAQELVEQAKPFVLWRRPDPADLKEYRRAA